MDTEILIEKMAFGGEGVGRHEGKVYFVPWAVPGDRVKIRVVSDQGRYARAEVVSFVEKSPFRIDPPCPVFGTCGGCQWQSVGYETQLHWKQEILSDTLTRVGKIQNPRVLPVIPAEEHWYYRSRIQLKVNEQKEIGFYRHQSHDVVPFEKCEIADERLNRKLRDMRQSGDIPKNEFELAVDAAGHVKVIDLVEDERFFSQVHVGQNKKLIEATMHMVFGNAEAAFNRKKTIVELYAGSGNFTFPLAEKAGQVVAVEENVQAVQAGEAKAEELELTHVQWIPGTAEWGLKKVLRRESPVDVLVLDPPRAGAKEILDLILLLKPRVVVYVSCDPSTLARDLQFLTKRYYQLECVQPIDMFPQTYHIESVSRLTLK